VRNFTINEKVAEGFLAAVRKIAKSPAEERVFIIRLLKRRKGSLNVPAVFLFAKRLKKLEAIILQPARAIRGR